MKEQEKENVYKQMSIILNQIQTLMKTYEDWKNYLIGLENDQQAEMKKDSISRKFAKEIETQKYFSEKGSRSVDNSYKTVVLKIAALSKEQGVPLSTRQIYELLSEKEQVSLSYSNLSTNILRRAHNDPKVNIERVFRGFWQYQIKEH
ncbi:hypothetical protein HQ708_07100 [Enterococcus faecium]|nr:hypothetical protein [Enterococcus faecium]